MAQQGKGKQVELTVAVVTFSGSDPLDRCLQALCRQQGATEVEVIVPYRAQLKGVEALIEKYPTVEFLSVPNPSTYAHMRSLAVRRARGGVVAITEDHCIPEDDWVVSIMEAHKMPFEAIGGVVEKDEPDKLLNWALYFADYARYMPPMEAGEATQLTDLNVSYKGSALDSIASVWSEEFHEPEVHAHIREGGGSLWLSPSIKVRQRRAVPLADALNDRYRFGRLFGSRRVKQESFTKRSIWAAGSLLLPALLIIRVLTEVQKRGRHRIKAILSLPIMAGLMAAWSAGECLGYLTGSAEATLAYQAPSTGVNRG